MTRIKMIKSGLFTALLTVAGTLAAQQDINVNLTPQAIPGGPSNQGSDPTSGYGNSTVQTQLRLEVKDATRAVHFIRDNTDPFVVTKAYLLKHASPYAIRGYLLTVVQGSTISTSPVQVDAIRYNDGTGIVLVSAEDYRFEKTKTGESIDELITRLDQPGMGFSSGQPKFIYFPKINRAADLKEMVMNVGANASGDFELEGGTDSILVDGQLNAMVVYGTYWTWKNMLAVLKEYDRPVPEVRFSYKLIEVFAENDDKLGVDFQSWKNNEGADFFSAGGQYRNNWASTFAGSAGVNGSGFSRTDYYNFNPKWNTKYLDFLTSCGKAKLLTQGTLLAKNRKESGISVQSGLFYDDVSETIPAQGLNSKVLPGDTPVPGAGAAIEIEHGKKQITKVDDGFRFELKIDPVVTRKSTLMNLDLNCVSLIGWNSDGTPRVSRSGYKTEIQIGNNGKNFVVGGIRKVQLVRGTAGLPLLKDLPGLGWLFSTESESTKRSQIVLIATAEYVHPRDTLSTEVHDNIGKAIEDVKDGINSPVNNLGYEQLLLDTKKVE